MSSPATESGNTDGVKHCARHPDVETRLSCASCGTPICPKCMVMCDVGIKCQACVNKTTSHVMQLGRWNLLAAGGLGILAGVIYGSLYPLLLGIPFLSFFGIPILSLLVSYGVGRGLGEVIRKLSGRKMGPVIAAVVTVAACIGLVLGPFGAVMAAFLAVFESAQNMAGNATTSAAFYGFTALVDLAMAYVFIVGLRSAFLYK